MRDAFIEEHCPLANATTMEYLQRALPNYPPPDRQFTVEGDERSNVLIATIISRPRVGVTQFTNLLISVN